MRNTLKAFKDRALSRADVRREYDALAEDFELLDEILKARAAAGLTQAEVAARIGTTQAGEPAGARRCDRDTQALRISSGLPRSGTIC